MAYAKQISEADVLQKAIEMIEVESLDDLSLRAVAASLGVKAPSLYRYFASKEALELEVAEETQRRMLLALQAATEPPDPEARFLAFAGAYLNFARDHAALYAFTLQRRLREIYGSPAGKALWNLLLEVIAGLSGDPDDTSAGVAVWSFLHGYAVLEQSGGFGASGPHSGLGVGLQALLDQLRKRAR